MEGRSGSDLKGCSFLSGGGTAGKRTVLDDGSHVQAIAVEDARIGIRPAGCVPSQADQRLEHGMGPDTRCRHLVR